MVVMRRGFANTRMLLSGTSAGVTATYGGGMLFLGVADRNSILNPQPRRDPEISLERLSLQSPWGEKGRHHPFLFHAPAGNQLSLC